MVRQGNQLEHLPTKTLCCESSLLRKQKLQSIRVNPKTAFEPYPNPKNSPLGPQKAKNYPKIRSTINVRIQGSIENESYSPI